jgi:hypothetical protein
MLHTVLLKSRTCGSSRIGAAHNHDIPSSDTTLRSVLGIDIDLNGETNRRGRVGILSEDALRPEDPQLRVLRHLTGRADGVLKLVSSHC